MLDRLRRGLTYANVMSTLAVFAVLGGGAAWAGGKIGPSDIAKNAVRSKHVRNGQVKTADLHARVLSDLATTGAGSNSSPGYGSGGTFNELRSVTVHVGPGNHRVFIVGSNEFWGPGTTCSGRIRLEWQGTQRDETLASQIAAPHSGNNYGTVVTQATPVLPAGTHEIKLYGAYFDGCSSMNSKLTAIVLDG